MAFYTPDMFQYNTSTSGYKQTSPPASANVARYHPYTLHGSRNNMSTSLQQYYRSTDELPGSSLGVPPGSFQTAAWHTAGNGLFLQNAFANQDYTATQTCDIQQQLYALRCLQNICGSDTTTTVADAGRTVKDLNHPFYWRRRVAPAEGMTRTRDKYRVVYTEKQREGLEKEYEENKFITSQRKAELSKELSLSDRQIKIWFQNRRAKERRESKKSESPNSSCQKYPENDQGIVPVDNMKTTSISQLPSCRYAEHQTSTSNAGHQAAAPDAGLHATKHNGYNRDSCLFAQPLQASKPTTDLLEELERSHFDVPISPSDWSSASSSDYVPQLNVSPLTVNADFGLVPRI